MKVNEIVEKLNLTPINAAQLDREVSGVYAGDLLSWVMGHANEGEVLVTIMSNINVLAVASLLDLSLVILSEGVTADEEFLKTAREKEINVFSSKNTTYGVCADLAKIL